jgi:hypothetical protein
MTILDTAGIQAQINAMPDEDFEITTPERGSILCPITDGHVALAMAYFKANWKPGTVPDFRALSRLSACKPGTARDFTADNIPEGRKLSPKQIEFLFGLFLAEREERFPPPAE